MFARVFGGVNPHPQRQCTTNWIRAGIPAWDFACWSWGEKHIFIKFFHLVKKHFKGLPFTFICQYHNSRLYSVWLFLKTLKSEKKNKLQSLFGQCDVVLQFGLTATFGQYHWLWWRIYNMIYKFIYHIIKSFKTQEQDLFLVYLVFSSVCWQY